MIDTPRRARLRRPHMAIRVLAGLGLLAGTLLCVPGSSWASNWGPYLESTDCNAELVGENEFWSAILNQARRSAISSLTTVSPTSLTGSDNGEKISLSWTESGGIPTGWYTEVCAEREAFVLNMSDEVCIEIGSEASTTSAEVSQCIDDRCSHRDVWRIRVRLRTSCNNNYTD